jgi:capsular polysaccharide biosynthesis protein
MYEVLPRWRIIKTSKLDFSGGVYACLQHRFHRESLALLGLIPSRMIDSASQAFFCADTIYVPSFLTKIEPWITQWLRDTLLAPALKHSSLHTRKRLYISRKQASYRKVANEPALIDLLKKNDFTEICLEDYSLSGQIALFHDAQAIVAPHGAGLTNLTFSECDAFVLELISDGLDSTRYESIARNRSLQYYKLRCALVEPANTLSTDIKVDLNAVEDLLGLMK